MKESFFADRVFFTLELIQKWLSDPLRLIMHTVNYQLYVRIQTSIYQLDIMEKAKEHLPLKVPLKFWYQHFVKGEGDFEDSLLPVADVATVEQFWAYYQHFKRPANLKIGSYLYLFKHDIKPVWEDPANKNGGAFVLRFERTKLNRLWQDILLGFISAKDQVYEHLNGIRIKVKKDFAEIDFWVSKVDDEKMMQFYRRWIIELTTLDNDTPLEVIHFQVEE